MIASLSGWAKGKGVNAVGPRFPHRAGAVHHKFVGRHPQVTFQETGNLGLYTDGVSGG